VADSSNPPVASDVAKQSVAAAARTEPKGLSRLAIFLPGILVAATGVGAGDLLTASIGGSEAGLVILWAAVVGALGVIHIDSETALAYAISVHVLNSAGVIVLGLIGLAREGQTLERLMREVGRVSAGRQPDATPPA